LILIKDIDIAVTCQRMYCRWMMIWLTHVTLREYASVVGKLISMKVSDHRI